MKKEAYKWQFHFTFGRDYQTHERGWKMVEFGILNLHLFPEPGEMLQRRHYRGFLLKFYIWFPLDF